ncbi:MAG: hypothetical protein IKL92_06635 [Oscillospiraceae bacterium]|nr:hypothetical protein [Oscillospiraceae bacterium]
MKDRSTRRKISLAAALTILFIILKLTEVIEWSWVWVLSPVWLTVVFFALVFGFILVGGRLKKGRW